MADSSEWNPLGDLPTPLATMLLVAVPSATMLLGSIIVYCVEPGLLLLAAFQNLSAGIILGAVCTEVFPQLMEAEGGITTTLAIFVGGAVGVFLMFGLGMVLPDEDDDDDDVTAPLMEDQKINTARRPSGETKPRRWSAALLGDGPSRQAKSDEVPYSTVLGVSVDAALDGFLCGVAYVATPQAGMIMAGATCIEMGFLGVSYTAGLRRVVNSTAKLALLSILPPFLMLATGAAAGAIGLFIQSTAWLFAAFLSFGVVALLFLVTQELLIEAHENLDGKELPFVNSMFFLGLFIVIGTERVIDDYGPGAALPSNTTNLTAAALW